MNDSEDSKPIRWQRLQTLYNEAMTVATVNRVQFVLESCRNDSALRDQLMSLVALEDSANERAEALTGIARSDDAPLVVGTVIDRYRIIRPLGAGGMGTVYLAERADSEFHQQVAIKLVNRSLVSPNVIARMRGERQILANLNHPNIARLVDGGATTEGVPYLVMEYIEGTRIDLYCTTHQLDIRTRLKMFQQVCSAVHAAHQQLIIHRDIKPSNILVMQDGAPKLLDFGIAKLLDASARISDTALTMINERMLTPEYASPEQIRGETLGTASDVYALGILLYELLCGVKPYRFTGSTLLQLEKFIDSHIPLKPSQVVASISKTTQTTNIAAEKMLRGDLDTIVMKAMHKDIARRYASVSALSEDIERYLDDRPISAQPDTLRYLAVKFWQRNRWLVGSTAIMLVTIVCLSIFYAWQLKSERDAAQRERLTADRVSQFMTEVFRVANPNESRGNTVPAREVLDSAVARIDKDLHNEPEVQNKLLRKMAQAYIGIGLWNEAKQLLDRAVTLQNNSSGKQQLQLADTLTELARIQARLNDFKTERVSLERALDIRTSLHEDNSPDAIPLWIAWAKNNSTRGNFDAALQAVDRAEAIVAKHRDISSLTIGNIYSARGDVYSYSNRYKEADAAYNKALPLLHGFIDQGADPYLETALQLGYALILESKLEEAQRFMIALLHEMTPLYPKNHPSIAFAWNELGIAYCDSGMYLECSDAFRKSADIEQQLSPSSVRLAMMYGNLGSAYRDAGKVDQSLTALDQGIKMMIAVRDDLDPNLVGMYYEQAAALRMQGKLAAAEQSLIKGERLIAHSTDTTNPTRYFMETERGRWLIAKGQAESAITQLQKTLGNTPAESQRLLANIHLALGQAFLTMHRCDDAIRETSAAYEIRHAALPKQNWYIYEAQNNLGRALSECGKLDEATPVLTGSVNSLRPLRPADDISLAEAQQNLKAHQQRIATKQQSVR